MKIFVDYRSGLGRRRFIKGVGSATALALATPVIRKARGQETYTFRMAHAEALGSPITEAFETWGQVLEERSGGRIDAQHFPAGQLGGYTQLIEASRLGTIQATAGGPDTELGIAPEIVPVGGAPGFIYESYEHAERVLTGPIAEEASRIARKKTGVEFVAYGTVGFRHLLANRPVETLEDLQGLKIRVPELKIWIRFWSLLGANPTPLPYGQQYTALATGLIESLAADVFSILGFKWYEQAKHLTLTYHWYLPKAIRVNAAWLDALPADLQDLVRQSAQDVFTKERVTVRATAHEALEELKSRGVIVHELQDRQKWIEAVQPLYEEFASKDPAVREMMEKIRALASG